VELTNETNALVLPNFTAAADSKFVPVMVTCVPDGPEVGEIAEIFGLPGDEVSSSRLALTMPHPATVIETTSANTATDKRFIMSSKFSKIFYVSVG
jgi:hypothetical protein